MYDDIIARTKAVLQKVPPNTAEAQKAHLRACMALSVEVLSARVAAHAAGEVTKGKYLLPKDNKEYTDLDRSIRLHAEIADEQATIELLVGLEKLLIERIITMRELLFGRSS